MSKKLIAALFASVVFGLFVLGRVGYVLVEWLWFSSVGYGDVFWTIFTSRAVLFITVLAISAGALWLSGWLALRFARRPAPWSVPASSFGPPHAPFGRLSYAGPRYLRWRLLLAGTAVGSGLMIALGQIGSWDLALRFLYQVPFGASDPVFGKEIGFYIFSLPVYVALKNWLMLLVLLAAAIAGAVYWVHGQIALDRRPLWLAPVAIAHGSALLAIFFLLKAWSYSLDRFLLLYSDNGVVVGAGYTDLHVTLPILWFLIALAVACAATSVANVRWRSARLGAGTVAVLLGSSLVFSAIFPALFQRFYVKPSELELEAPYIARNISLTLQAFDLNRIEVKPFPVEDNLSFGALQANRETIDNIRLWDWQPLMDTYAQLQEIRTYYKFLVMDVDRYQLEGGYRQVMLAARELEPRLLPSNAQTWVNLHLLFTHGTGAVMSPVTQKSAEGLPTFYLQDIPPVARGGPQIREPRLYFGEAPDRFAIVRSSTPEFDYPKGKDNVYASYDGADGVAIGSMASRSLFAWHYGDPNILVSTYITPESRILLHRNIRDRVGTLAPSLSLDSDPYLVVSDGRLFWIQDAYTTSEWYPYVQPSPSGGVNYIRNAAKVVIDAYNGSVQFFVSDPRDPLIRTYQRIFPGLFKPLAEMPSDLRRHIRYPEDLFLIQAQLYRAYHMDTPEVFYNREDLWQFPRQAGTLDGSLSREDPRMAPYYMVVRLPGEERAEFVLMLPMAPSQRDNMIAWLAARCDPPHYGEVVVYEFPKDKLVYGPFQIEARIQQNTDISQQISLWNQMGSRVIRGHLQVVPIENSLLYVSPLYLRARSGQLPELKRVIASYGDRVVMEETLGAALAALFKDSVPVAALPSTGASAGATGAVDARAREALAHYDRAIERLKAGDWTGFGAELDALRPLLEALGRPPGTR